MKQTLQMHNHSKSDSESSSNVSMIDCGIKSLKDIPIQLNTASINLHSNVIQKIENLNYLQRLIHLDLSSNTIKKIDGLQGLVSLKSLNLSCNSIINIENLDGLKCLRSLNLSYNKIQYINGLSDIWGTEYALDALQLHGNFLSSVEELTYYLNGLLNLKYITLHSNKFLNSVNYSVAVFSSSKSLVSIDGKDKNRREVTGEEREQQELNYFQEFLDWSKSIDGSSAFSVNCSNLGQPKKKFPCKNLAQNSPVRSRNSSSNSTCNTTNNNTTYLSNEINDILIQNPNLTQIEAKLNNLLALRDRFNSKPHKTKKSKLSSTSSSSIDSDDETNSHLSTPSTSTRRTPQQIRPSRSHGNLTKPGYIKSILKPSINISHGPESAQISLDTSLNESSKNDENDSQISMNKTSNTEFINIMQTQLEAYKKSTELNIQLINDLRSKLESVTEEKNSLSFEKDTVIKTLNESNKLLSEKNSELMFKNQNLEDKLSFIEKSTSSKPSESEIIDCVRTKMKRSFASELVKYKQSTDSQIKIYQEKLASSEKEFKSLEAEFRGALIIESNRYNELYGKYEKVVKESADIKATFSKIEENETRNKSLIKELNELIKEQKIRLQTFTKVRKEASDDIQAKSDKLSEAVANCAKLKEQIENLKKEKTKIESQLKLVALKYKEIEDEKETWTQKLADQKSLVMQEMSRLTVENKTSNTEIEILKKNHDRELNDNKIKAKIIEDQAETIKKLKSGLVERDSSIKDHREESLKVQKSLEKQLNEEIDLNNEIQLKYEKVNERKEDLKVEVEELKGCLAQTKSDYDDLTFKWKQKSELITELDSKVRKMKENYELKEKTLLQETQVLTDEKNSLNERLRKIDDSFRQQYDVEKKEHFKQVEVMKRGYEEKLQVADLKIEGIEEEMRQILTETSRKKKFYEDKIKSFTSAFRNIQADFEVTA